MLSVALNDLETKKKAAKGAHAAFIFPLSGRTGQLARGELLRSDICGGNHRKRYGDIQQLDQRKTLVDRVELGGFAVHRQGAYVSISVPFLTEKTGKSQPQCFHQLDCFSVTGSVFGQSDKTVKSTKFVT